MKTATATVPTSEPQRYLKQLCRHFAHNRSVDWTDTEGVIRFDYGDCGLEARAGELHISVAGHDAPSLERLQRVVASHLERFSFRDPLRIDWGAGVDETAIEGRGRC